MSDLSNKKLFKVTFYSGMLKTIFTIILGIVTVPYSLKYFGVQKFGIWNVIMSFIVFLNMTNLGLNAAATILINKNQNIDDKIIILKKSFIILSIIIPVILIIIFVYNYVYPGWIEMFKVPILILNEVKFTILIMVVFTIVNVPFSLISSALNGLQKNHIENFFNILSVVLSTSTLFVVILLKKNLIFYAYLNGFTSLFLNFIKLAYFKIVVNEMENVNLTLIEKQNFDTTYEVIIKTSYRCMLGALASMFVLNSDNIVIANILGVEFVTPFSVTFKIYTSIFSLIYLVNSSIIPLIGRNILDINYINKVYNNTLFFALILGGLFWIGTVSFAKTLIYMWVGPSGYAGVFALIFLGGYSYIFAIVNLNNIVINSLNLLKGYAYITWFEVFLNLTFSIILGKIYGLGGIAAGTFLGVFISPFIIGSIFLSNRSNNMIIQNNYFIIRHFLWAVIPFIFLAYFINMLEISIFENFSYTFILCLTYLFISYLCLSVKTKIELNEYIKNLAVFNIYAR